MDLIYNKIFLEHDTGMHPENKKRLEILEGIEEHEIENGEKYLSYYHTEEYINKVKECSQKGMSLDQDTVTSKKSYEAAVHAVGATIMASQQNGFALVRPPGHHAHPEKSSGFCIFNNIAIASKKLVEEGKKVLIFDFDGHHGDGTSKHFFSSNDVMYWSLHQFPAFPGSGAETEIGEGEGKGYTINVPLPPGAGDDLYLEGLNRFLPIAQQFNPDIVAISAGWDAHQYDLLLDLKLSLNSFYETGRFISKNFRNFFATLEGGYNVEMFPKCLYNFLDGVNGDDCRFKEETTESEILRIDEAHARMDTAERLLSEYWKI